MRTTDSPSWFVPAGQLDDATRSFAGRVVINPRDLHRAGATLNSVAADLDVSVPAPPRLPPGGKGMETDLAEIESQLRQCAGEMRAMASLLVRRAQYAHAGQDIGGTAPTDHLASIDLRREVQQIILADMEKRNLSTADRALLESLIKRGLSSYQYEELLNGGHLLIEGRELHEQWRKLDGVYDRSSSNSHYRKPERIQRDGPRWGNHYGFDSDELGGVLFGPGPGGSTFIQLEGHGMHTTDIIDIDYGLTGPRVGIDADKASESLGHMDDYYDYRNDPEHRNRGPHGTSVHNDSNPMVLGNVKFKKR